MLFKSLRVLRDDDTPTDVYVDYEELLNGTRRPLVSLRKDGEVLGSFTTEGAVEVADALKQVSQEAETMLDTWGRRND